MSRRLAAILICAAEAQWQGHGTRARHPALDAALTAYPEIHARETEKLKNGDPTARFVMARVTNGLGNRNYGIIASFALALYKKAALFVHWPEQHCDGFADAEGVGKRHQAAEAGRFHWRIDDVWPRLRDEVKKRKGGIFVAADGHLALLRNALESRAWEDGIPVMTSAQSNSISRRRFMT